jgi:hypothetical protein
MRPELSANGDGQRILFVSWRKLKYIALMLSASRMFLTIPTCVPPDE